MFTKHHICPLQTIHPEPADIHKLLTPTNFQLTNIEHAKHSETHTIQQKNILHFDRQKNTIVKSNYKQTIQLTST